MPSIPHPLHRQITTLLSQTASTLPAKARFRVAWMLWAILLSGTCVLRQIATTVASCAPKDGHASSHERRLRRIIADPRLTWEALYAPLVRFLLRHISGSITVIVDESGHSDIVRALTAALWYQGRAIPLAWITWKGQTPHEQSYWDDCATLFDRVAKLVPEGVKVTVVADRAFGCPAFLDPLTERGWDWVARVQGQTRIKQTDNSEAALKSKVSGGGHYWWERVRVFKNQGWRKATVVAYWRKGCKEPLLLVSSLLLPMLSVRMYRLRAAIEALFRDWKSYGWQWEDSQIDDVEHQERLLLMVALATLLTILVGVEAAELLMARPAQQGKRRPWEARDSLFQLGRQRCLTRLWTSSEEAMLDSFSPPGTKTWQQRCWSSAAPNARMATVKDDTVVQLK
jgi:hypothetical protein